MTITNSVFSVNYLPVEELKKKFILAADILKPYFTEPTILPIPDNAPDDIPRATCQTTHGHSELVLTKKTLQFTTTYDNEFQSDWSRCRIYILDKIQTINELLQLMDCTLTFSGLTTQILTDTTSKDGTSELVKKFSKVNTEKTIFDFGQKIVTVVDDIFFVNYQLNNIRLYKGINGQNEFTPGFLAGQNENHISVVIDINDRYDFNYHTDFKSDPSRLNQILALTDKAIKNFDKLVFNGELII